jgi:hypothetical protein
VCGRRRAVCPSTGWGSVLPTSPAKTSELKTGEEHDGHGYR